MHEFGMRMALGASPWDVMRLVISQGVLLAILGVVLGLGTAMALAGLLDSMLYGVSVTDPLTLTCVGAMAVATSLLACYPSARRATSADPITALRAE